MQIIIICVKGR